MINLVLKKIFLILFFLFCSSNILYAKTETVILYKIDDQIITNIDVNNEFSIIDKSSLPKEVGLVNKKLQLDQ